MGHFVEDKMRRFKNEYAHFTFNKCPIYTRDGASTKCNTISQETDNSEGEVCITLSMTLTALA
jgi:hypothetical protein